MDRFSWKRQGELCVPVRGRGSAGAAVLLGVVCSLSVRACLSASALPGSCLSLSVSPAAFQIYLLLAFLHLSNLAWTTLLNVSVFLLFLLKFQSPEVHVPEGSRIDGKSLSSGRKQIAAHSLTRKTYLNGAGYWQVVLLSRSKQGSTGEGCFLSLISTNTLSTQEVRESGEVFLHFDCFPFPVPREWEW